MPFLRRRSRRTRENLPPQPWASPRPTSGLLSEQRSYVPDAPYLLPKDTLEDQRLNYQHHVLYKTLSNHYLAPLSPDTSSVLDVGAGTGSWLTEIAGLFP